MIEKYLPYSFVIGGFVFVSLAVFIKKLRFIRNATTTIGIVKNLESEDSEGSYRQVVEFDTDERKTITIKSNMMTGSYKNSIGTAVTVLYDKDNPEYGEINTFLNLWGFELMLFVMAGGLLAVALSDT